MKSLLQFILYLSLYLLFSCSSDVPQQELPSSEATEPASYLYKPPTVPPGGLPVARVKNEDLAEAFVSRLSTKAPAGVVVMQQENLVLEEYFGKDSAAWVPTGFMFPGYVTALLGSVYRNSSGVPYLEVPLKECYPAISANNQIVLAGHVNLAEPQPEAFLLGLEKMIQARTGTSMGMAAEEYLFEPLQIDDYKWHENSLLVHPHGILQLGSLLVKRGRWRDQQILSDDLVQSILAPAYENNALVYESNGWNYYRMMAKGRKHAVLYWHYGGAHLFILPEVEAVILLQGEKSLMPEAWDWLQQYLIPSLSL